MGRENFQKRQEIARRIEELDDNEVTIMMMNGESIYDLIDEVPVDDMCDICDVKKWTQIIFVPESEFVHICKACYIMGNWDNKLGIGDILF